MFCIIEKSNIQIGDTIGENITIETLFYIIPIITNFPARLFCINLNPKLC